MTDAQPGKSEIVAISRISHGMSFTGRGKNRRTETHGWTVYGRDANGTEHVHVEHATDQEHHAWRATDPLWREAQRVVIGRLMDDPRTRDLVLQINIKAALDAGDTDTAVELARHLSAEAWHRLTQKGSASTEA
jgi:hypothetical protein